MSIIDSIYNGSYDGVPFVIEGSTTTGGRKTSKKEYPNRDEQTIEDLGLRPRGYVLKIVVNSNSPSTYFRDRDAFLAKLDEGGGKELVHPYYGKLSNMAVIDWKITEEDTRLGEGKLTVTFDPTDGTGVPEATAVTSSAVKKASSNMKALQTSSFREKFGVTNSNFGNPTSAIGKLNGMVDTIKDSLSFVEGITTEVNAFSKELNDFSNNIVSLLEDPIALSDSINNLFISIANVSNSPDLLFTIFKRQFGFGDDDVSLDNNVTPTNTERNNNSNALNSMMNINSIAGAFDSAADITYDTVEDVDNIANQLDEEYERINEAEDVSVDVKDSLTEARVILVEFFNQQRIGAAELIDVYTQTTSCRLLSYSYYGDSTRDDEISEQNNISDIDFVKGDVQILSD